MPDKFQLLFHINKLTNIYRLYILLFIAPDILVVAHDKGHLRFFYCYEIITCFWFIRGLTKLLCTFICHCSQCLALQTRRHALYGSFKLIELPFVLFFTQTLDFILALPLSKSEYNVIISVICKFSKRVILIEDANT